MFSEASRRIIEEWGNIELYELEEFSKTVQCPASSRYAPEGLLHMRCMPHALVGTEKKD